MKMNIYAIFDKAIGAYMRPFFMQADGQAIRAFTDLAVQADHEIGQHPEDYSLYRLGSFDDSNAEIEVVDARCLARAHELAAKSREFKAVRLPDSDFVDGADGTKELKSHA